MRQGKVYSATQAAWMVSSGVRPALRTGSSWLSAPGKAEVDLLLPRSPSHYSGWMLLHHHVERLNDARKM